MAAVAASPRDVQKAILEVADFFKTDRVEEGINHITAAYSPFLDMGILTFHQFVAFNAIVQSTDTTSKSFFIRRQLEQVTSGPVNMNHIRGKAFENLALNFFSTEVQRGEKPVIKPIRLPDSVIAFKIFPFLNDSEKRRVFFSAKSMRPLLAHCLSRQSKMNWPDLDKYLRLGFDITKFSHLTEVSLSGCSVSDRDLDSFCNVFPGIQRIALGFNNRVTNLGLAAVGRHCVHLTSFEIYDNGHVSDAGVEELAQRCTRLRTVTLMYCPRIGNGSLKTLATHCRHLESIAISSCRNLTDEVAQLLAKNCPKMSHFGTQMHIALLRA